MEALRVPLRAVGRAAWPRCSSPAAPTRCWIPAAGAAGGRAGVPLEPELAVRLNGAILLVLAERPARRR